MRYFLADYESVKSEMKEEALKKYLSDSLTEQDCLILFFADEKESQVFPQLLEEFRNQKCPADIKAKISPHPSEADRACAFCLLAGMLWQENNEIRVISKISYCANLFRSLDEKLYSVFYFSTLWAAMHSVHHRIARNQRQIWSMGVNNLLNSLELTEEERNSLNLIFKHARRFSDTGRRKWETHNKIQNLVRNRERCTEIYKAFLPLLLEIDHLH
ncbi:MAG: hypothetical protein IJ642_03925 [Oscillospiraceae bacterium]|nr:hypothetical protein [Oscillospiraceae bacterium]